MSGQFTRSKYDECATKEAAATAGFMPSYHMFMGAYENPSNTNLAFPCDGSAPASIVARPDECKICDVNKGTLSHGLETLPLRIDIENALRLGSNPGPADRCIGSKPQPCGIGMSCKAAAPGASPASLPAGCYADIIANPLLCDRAVMPTNMVRQK